MSQSFNNSPPPTDPWPELFAGYVLGDLSSEDMITVQRYLETNPEVIAEIEQLQTTLALLPLGLEDIPVPNELKASILSEVERSQSVDLALNSSQNNVPNIDTAIAPRLEKSTNSRPNRSIRKPNASIPWSAITTGIATLVALGLGIQSHSLQQEMAATRRELGGLRHAQEQIAQQDDRYRNAVALMNQPNSRMLTMTGSGAVAAASGNIVIAPDQNRALLSVKNMPQPPSGKVYHLWAIVAGNKVACAQFSPESDGQALLQLPANRWTNATQVVITLEPEQSEAQPTGEMVMTGQKL
jgi:anti-sigma-K factor RskA